MLLSASLELSFLICACLSCPSGSTAVLSGSTAEARQAVVPLANFGRSTTVVPGYYRLDSRPMFFVSGFTVLAAAVGGRSTAPVR